MPKNRKRMKAAKREALKTWIRGFKPYRKARSAPFLPDQLKKQVIALAEELRKEFVAEREARQLREAAEGFLESMALVHEANP